MTTSANVTRVRVLKNRKQVGEHRQHFYCKTNWEKLLEYSPIEDHQIQPVWADEDEVDHEGEVENLLDFLVRCNPCPLPGIPHQVHCIIKRDPETGEWSGFGGFVENLEELRKEAEARFGAGNYRILNQRVSPRPHSRWGQTNNENSSSSARHQSPP